MDECKPLLPGRGYLASPSNPDRSWEINYIRMSGQRADLRTQLTDDKVNDEVAALDLVKVGWGGAPAAPGR